LFQCVLVGPYPPVQFHDSLFTNSIEKIMEKNTTEHISVAKYWEGVHSALDVRLRVAKEYLKHPVTGISAENYFRDLLKEYLPRRFVAEPGFTVNTDGERSKNIDIIIADTFHIPPLCSEPNYKVFAIESVCAAIEITTAPNSKVKQDGRKIPKFNSDIKKLAKVRSMGRRREYVDLVPCPTQEGVKLKPFVFTIDLRPMTFLITSGNEWAKAETYEKNLLNGLRNVRDENRDTWLNAVFSLRHGMLHFERFSDFKSKWIKENSLLEFLLFLNNAIATIPTFKIDIQKYRPTIQEIEGCKT